MKKILTILFLSAACSTAAMAQSSSDVAMAKSMAKAYGYSDDEIERVIKNRDIKGNVTGPSGNSDYLIEERTAVPNQALHGKIDIQGEETPIEIKPVDGQADKDGMGIYGQKFFVSKGLSLIPSVTAPVPESYIIGPGDQVLIDIWGNVNISLDLKVASNGSITVPKLGPVFISGKKISEAEKFLTSRLTSIYSGLSDGSVSLSLAVGKIRGVSVYVLGAVQTPGVFTLPSLCSAATAIYLAGGIRKMGSVRNIFIFRGGKKIATFDLYKFIFDGQYNNNMRLQDGDIISVSTLDNVVTLSGPVRTESRFEMKDSETLADLFKYAGGFDAKARNEMVHVDRLVSKVATSYDVKTEQFASFKLADGDSVSVAQRAILFDNKVSIEGNVAFPGSYSITDNLSTMKDLFEAAGGLLEGTYMRRASIRRLDKERMPVEVSFVPQEIVDGKSNIALHREDEVIIYSNAELLDNTTVSINGYVNSPGKYDYRNGMTVGDLLLMAKGISDGADLTHVEIASKGRESSGQITSLNLIDHEEFLSSPLQPYDIVYIRPRENYRELKTIEILGEVKYPGLYAVEKNSVRLSDILERANGFTADAYVKGTKLKRKYTDEEIIKAKLGKLVAAQKIKDPVIKDSLMRSDSLAFGEYFYVSLKVTEALKKPGSPSDVILRDGDIIEVPQMNNTVKISGAVYLPNTVSFNPKATWRDYVNMAGGFSKNARRGEIFAIYQDGSTAAKGSADFVMEPGMELFVPTKDDAAKRQISGAEIAAIASSISSIAYMTILLINQFKK